MARRWRLLAVLTASYGAGAFGMLGISPLSPSRVEGLALSRLQVALIVPSIYLGGLLFSRPGGRGEESGSGSAARHWWYSSPPVWSSAWCRRRR